MAINDDIITKQKLIEFEKVSHFDTWEESEQFVDLSILGEMDWYLIDGLLNDYLKVMHGKKIYLNDFLLHLEDSCDDDETINFFKLMAEDYNHGLSEEEDDVYAEAPVITAKKLYQFDRLLSFGNWDDIEDRANHKVINKADWKLIDGLMGYFISATRSPVNEELLPRINRSLHTFCDNEQTITIFKELSKGIDLK